MSWLLSHLLLIKDWLPLARRRNHHTLQPPHEYRPGQWSIAADTPLTTPTAAPCELPMSATQAQCEGAGPTCKASSYRRVFRSHYRPAAGGRSSTQPLATLTGLTHLLPTRPALHHPEHEWVKITSRLAGSPHTWPGMDKQCLQGHIQIGLPF